MADATYGTALDAARAILDFCNKIGTLRPFGPVPKTVANGVKRTKGDFGLHQL